jgi:membrane dipeptidase
MPALRWIDGHLDLAYLALNGRDLTTPLPPDDPGCVTLPALREAGVDVVLGTIFTELGVATPYGYASIDDLDGAERAGAAQLEWYQRMEDAGEIAIVRKRADLDAPGPIPKVVILMEGADPIRSPAHASWWVDRGVRIIGLTWALGSRYAGGNGRHGPLSDMGRDMVHTLDALGVTHDASHLADEAMAGLLELSRGRIIASHSNSRALLGENQRHLTDEHLRSLRARDGLVGLNLYSTFLTPVQGQRATLADCVRHVEHAAAIVGRSRVALGSDMDGGFGRERLPVGVDGPERLVALAGALQEAGWSEAEIGGFAHGNWQRVLREALQHPRS